MSALPNGYHRGVGTMSSGDQQVDPALVEALQKKINTLAGRVDDLESQLEEGESSTSSTSSGVEHRDQAVLDQIDAGDHVSVSYLKQLYRINTDIRSDRTLKNRVQSLTNRPEFTWTAPGNWVYQGQGGESDE